MWKYLYIQRLCDCWEVCSSIPPCAALTGECARLRGPTHYLAFLYTVAINRSTPRVPVQVKRDRTSFRGFFSGSAIGHNWTHSEVWPTGKENVNGKLRSYWHTLKYVIHIFPQWPLLMVFETYIGLRFIVVAMVGVRHHHKQLHKQLHYFVLFTMLILGYDCALCCINITVTYRSTLFGFCENGFHSSTFPPAKLGYSSS